MKAVVFAAVAALSAVAGSAFAAETLSVTLEQPVASRTKVVAGGTVWTCEGTTCMANSSNYRTASLRACQSLTKEVGRIANYGTTKPLDADNLAKCNMSAAKPQTLQAAN